MKIYLASSWRNSYQPSILEELRQAGHDVYDFKNPPDRTGFGWSQIDPDWKNWTTKAYLGHLTAHPLAHAGFKSDWEAMCKAEAGVLLLPSGRSAHIEAGYFVGAGKPLVIYLPEGEQLEPELMYLMATEVVTNCHQLTLCLSRLHESTALNRSVYHKCRADR